MRFFHLSDLHIGLKLIGRDLKEDQEYILRQIAEEARAWRPDAIVIAGDIYDKAVPAAEAVEVFDCFVSELAEAVPEAAVMIISGNHDSGQRINCFRSVLSRQNLYLVGLPPQTEQEHLECVELQDRYGTVRFYLMPFIKPSMVRQIVGSDEEGRSVSYEEAVRRMLAREEIDPAVRNVLVSHQFYIPSGADAAVMERSESEICMVGNIDAVSAEVLRPFDYAALGHIHKPMKAGKDVYRYCGTPLACSVSEAGQQKGIVFVEMGEKGDVKTTVIPLKPLREVREIKGAAEEILSQACNDYVSVILTEDAETRLQENALSGGTALSGNYAETLQDQRDRIRAAFPNLLEIRRENVRRPDYVSAGAREVQEDPFTLCCAFLGDAGEEEKELIRDVINSVTG